ncbi:Uma2 family endonuclease [Coleofasciculus sp. FACHB-1120]|uniref:Uma2 family endonuclease n=1 Tax=Coleofasciculus sp. FACHB-1120 TaxID=2692783 RepID=UPI001682B2CC|nr:Uma2 family endonuclease [Coleofasciculus sp. FACHB-1120]MBD2743824.1 Uma2 family endonuclease [Coleofasciculus sp. FACHB-1120]
MRASAINRLPASWTRNEACPVPPELAIEMISPNQTIKEFEEKDKAYFDAGVLRVWIVEHESLSIRVFSRNNTSEYTDNTPIIDSLFPGLEITPKRFFEESELV